MKNTLTLDPRQMARRPVKAACLPGLEEKTFRLLSRETGSLAEADSQPEETDDALATLSPIETP